MKSKRVYGVTCVLMVFASIAGATTIVMPTDEQLIEKSPVIVRGTVISSTPVMQGDSIWTETLLGVDSRIKGENISDTIVIREAGGILGDRMTRIFGSPEYVAGERVLVFLAPHPRGYYQTMDMFAGKFSPDDAPDGRRLWVRSEAEGLVEILTPDFQPAEPATFHRDAEAFEDFVRDRAAGRPATRDYIVPAVEQNGLRSAADFTLIDEPNVYRWFAFDEGQRVSWRSSGTQSGYPNGGIDEVRTAMASWTSFTEARILYGYDGTFSSSPAGLDRSNGINEVLLNDPLDEIAGAFNSRTGGVVGRGGFNGVSSSRTWTAPFAADSSHRGTYRAWNIVEGNLVIQDGVSPSAGMSSHRLAEIIAHEFGHTLGFGHNDDSSALMYASVTGIGPSLRDDDRVAARWLYPGSGSTPVDPGITIPNAPGSLTASASGTSVNLAWRDNASNETSQTVYYAAATGGFTKAGDVGANDREATVTGFTDGTWRFYVTASNSAGQSQPSNTATVTISTKPPVEPLVAAFTFTPQAPIAEDPVTFRDTSTGGVTSRLWAFGDGTTSGQANPIKHYAAGTYTVTLTVYRGSESRVVSRPIYVASRTPSLPPVEVYRSLIPVSAQSEGVGGSRWRTELTLFNAGSEGITINLIFVPGSGSGVQNRTVFLSPRQTRTYANALRDVFGMSAGSGAIAIEASGATATPALKVTSRTFNDADGGTYGLAVPDVTASDLQQTLYVAGLASTGEYRTNIGLVNRSSSATTVALTLYGRTGSVVASSNLTLPAGSFRQEGLTVLFPAVAGRDQSAMSMRVVADTANAVSVYGSVVDNRTHDPLYIAGVAAPAEREAIVPVAGRAPGANGTFWRSDVTVFNPTNGWMSVDLSYGGRTKSVFLMAKETLVIEDIVADLGLGNGTGTLVAGWDSGTGPIVTTRNYTPAPGGGTYGQAIDPVAGFGRENYVTGLRSDQSFRTNVGFVNGGTQPITVQATIVTASGAQAANATFQLDPDQLMQASIADLFRGLNTSTLGAFTLHATSNAPGLFAYGSVIDNASGDPVFVAGR